MEIFRKQKENKLQTLKSQMELLSNSNEGKKILIADLEKQINDINKKIQRLEEQKKKLFTGIENHKKSIENVSKQLTDISEKTKELEKKLNNKNEVEY